MAVDVRRGRSNPFGGTYSRTFKNNRRDTETDDYEMSLFISEIAV